MKGSGEEAVAADGVGRWVESRGLRAESEKQAGGGGPAVYPWMVSSAAVHDPAEAFKHLWLSRPFFSVRTVIYLALWMVLGVRLPGAVDTYFPVTPAVEAMVLNVDREHQKISLGIKQLVRGLPADSLRPGDVFITNDPYDGSTHLPDVVIVKPVFHEGRLLAFTAALAHMTDIGGRIPGGNASAIPVGIAAHVPGAMVTG